MDGPDTGSAQGPSPEGGPGTPTAASTPKPRRRWGRRLVWALASGVAVVAVGAWALQRPAVQQTLLGYADAKLREETGLGLTAEGFEFAPFDGRLVVRGLTVGGDLLRVARVEVRTRPFTLLGDSPRIRSLDIDGLALNLDQARLARLRLKPRDPKARTPDVRLDSLRIRGGSVEVREPAWGLVHALMAFDADGRGAGPNKLRVDLRSRGLSVQPRTGLKALEGSLALAAELGPSRIEVASAKLRLGAQDVEGRARIDLKASTLDASVSGHLDLGELPYPEAGFQGQGTFQGSAKGALRAPGWTFAFQGEDLRSTRALMQPGSLDLQATGSLEAVTLRELRWASADGILDATGAWRRGGRLEVAFQARDMDLGGLAERLRIPDLQGLRGDGEGDAALPWDPWAGVRPATWTAHTEVRLARGGEAVGGLKLALDRGRLDLPTLRLVLPDLRVEAEAHGVFGPGGLTELQAKGETALDVAKIARALKAWNIVGLDMGGALKAAADFSWSRTTGLRLDGGGAVDAPRWHGAIADRLKGTVQIRGNELFVYDLAMDRGEGQGLGDLWLTWADLPPGASQMDMCFRVQRLPVHEGLKAADLGDLPLEGTASGWARLGGPFTKLVLTGDVRVDEGRAYGIRLPAAAANFELDLTANRLRLPEYRIAESQELLYAADAAPGGLLALRGLLDMDLERGTWTGDIQGTVDSARLDLPGPRFLGRLDGSLEGPWTTPFGPAELPTGRLDLSSLRLFLGQQSLEGLHAGIRLRKGELEGELRLGNLPEPLLKVQALDSDGRAVGSARLRVAPDPAGTGRLARRLTDDVLEDLDLDLRGSGVWGPEGLRWEAFTQELVARFSAFTLRQEKPGSLSGDATTAHLDTAFEAREHKEASGPAGKVSLSGDLPFSFTAPVRVRATGDSQISEMKEVLDKFLDLDPYSLLANLRPAGQARMDLTLGGSFGHPTLDGTLSLEKGRLSVKSYPQSVEDLSFSLVFRERDILLNENAPLRGRLAQGALKAWGKATWTLGGETGVGGLSSYGVEARLDDFQVRDLPEGFELQGDLEASLRGDDENGGLLKGIVRAERTLYRADINLADLILSNTLGSTPDLSTLDPDDLLSRIELDLDLRLSQPWQFDTNLLKLQGRAEGPFRIRGTLAKPGLKGKMSLLPGGRFTNLLPAGDIVIEQGTLDFADPAVLDPVLNIQGRVDVPPYLVNLSLTGNLSQLSVSPTSTPSLRQDEIVRLLIDPASAQSVGSGATSQSTLNSGLASASYGLISTLAFARFQENLRKSLGLDRVSFAIRTGIAGTLESNLILGKTFNILDRRVPLLYGYRTAGETVTHSGQAEWRLGNLVMQLGLSRTGTASVNPTGEIRYTWSPRW